MDCVNKRLQSLHAPEPCVSCALIVLSPATQVSSQ